MVRTATITFKTISQEWLAKKKKSIKESSYVKYYNILEKHILPYMGAKPIEQLNTRFLMQFSHHLITDNTQKEPLADKSVKDIVSVLNNIIKYAKVYYPDWTSKIEIIYPQVRPSKTQTRILSRSEQRLLEEFLLQNMDLSKFGIYLCLYTGLRVGEICGLKWEDIDLNEKVISVNRTVQRLQTLDPNAPKKTHLSIDTPKSFSSMRFIPIPSFLLPIILTFFSNQEKEYVLTGDVQKCMEPRTFENHFSHFLSSAKEMAIEKGETSIDISNITLHSLRHTFATRCVEAGVEIKCLSEILGHANVNITLNRYVHSSIEMKRKNINKLSSSMDREFKAKA